MKEFKLNMTRPEFLRRILTNCDDRHKIDEEDLNRLLDKGHALPYCCYTAIMEANINPEDITYINIDEESVVVKLINKSVAKKIKEASHKEMIRLGMIFYKIKVKVDGVYVIVTATKDHTLEDLFKDD
jgi:hypothetical protein